MSIENIIFENDDTLQQTLIKTVLLNAGSPNRLSIELKKHKTKYVKVSRGAKTSYVLRSPKIGRLVVTL